jgi:fructose/tagatose bisphosphate aldolase
MTAVADLLSALDQAVAIGADGRITVNDAAKLREKVDHLARASALGAEAERAAARWLLWEIGQEMGILPASINDLYLARGRGETPTDFTVPAMNLRALAYDAARAAFRAANAGDVGAVIFEIARSEIGYTDQRPAEYLASILAGAVKEGYQGPVFVQGDHFQVNAKRYRTDPDAELGAVRDLTREAILAGFYNIDIDTSTLVDLDLPTLEEQQRLNGTLCAELTHTVRELEPDGVTVSVGGEIGEVGGKNSTEEELRAFMGEYENALGRGVVGLSKISVQTGTSHGGVVLPDGTLAQVKVDFGTLQQLSQVAREAFGMAGAVQHGASTLPESAFGKFAESEACEVHLATNFQNMLFDRLPHDLHQRTVDWLLANKSDQRKEGETEDQFLYKNRKHAIGQFKREMWDLPEDVRQGVRAAWEEQFGFLFERLNVVGTRDLVARHVRPARLHKSLHDFGGETAGEEDVSDLAD